VVTDEDEELREDEERFEELEEPNGGDGVFEWAAPRFTGMEDKG
jgi:hypothetical protein